MTNLDSILKSRDITLPTKVHLVKAMVFPLIIYGCESSTVKKECQRIDALELLCSKRLLRVPWTVGRSNQSILKEISPQCSLEILMLKLKLQYLATWCEELTHLKSPWCWGRLKVGGEGDNRGWDGWMASLTRRTWVWVSSGSWCWTGKPGMLRSNSTKSWTWLSDWTKLKDPLCFAYLSLPSPLQPLATTDLLAVSKFCLFRSLCNWNHSTCRFFRPASFT